MAKYAAEGHETYVVTATRGQSSRPITTRIEGLEHWPTVWKAVQCHETQLPGYASLADVSDEHRAGLLGRQTFYRVFNTVNGGRTPESDLLDGFGNEDIS